MKVLVTGASGFVGTWLVRRLIEDGHSLRVLRRKSSSTDESNRHDIEVSQGDISDAAALTTATQDVDTVFHLAGHIGYTRSERSLMELANVVGTQNVVAACKTNRVRRLVYMSSVVAVGASFNGRTPLNEDSPYNLHPYDFGYFETKWAAEQAVLAAVKSGHLDAVILNPSTIYGAGDARKGSRKLQVKVARGEFPFYSSGGVSIISVREVVEATLKAWQIGRTGERYILSGDNITIKELFQIIAAAAGVPAPAIALPNLAMQALSGVGRGLEYFGLRGPVSSESANSSIMFHWYDHSKAARELGLNPAPAAVSIGESVAWMKANGYLEKRP